MRHLAQRIVEMCSMGYRPSNLWPFASFCGRTGNHLCVGPHFKPNERSYARTWWRTCCSLSKPSPTLPLFGLQPIYDIAVLPTKPFIFASASRDKSVRVYDLTLQGSSVLLEANWPITASTRPLRLGKGAEGSVGRRGRNHPQPTDTIGTIGGLFGSQVPESLGGEGMGLGKCFLILRGSSKGGGGHHASVLAVVSGLVW